MINLNTTLSHKFFDVTIAQRISDVPPNGHHDQVFLKMTAAEIDHDYTLNKNQHYTISSN
ncbi:hypothetical protein AVI53_15825 (plasmid) [Piscirickettsia salmonis]|nr:hypothetical protein PSLF89_08230 [Piscirickettsia salmonis LF-89 = ATCC VR-1361]ALY04389.1 hypothetical protein AWE47_15785 [Piscirickettsia salmonis]AMA43877.1 hypothetical protein AWJ11_15900 [Piscirickettsia salmonis]AOS37097.1 hypothetical protein AVM72_17240 [Piscirickettsia salmonis]APS62041.1 hypothetical protein AVI53_15825 [Piscirickettsia salmonis]